MLDSTDLIAFLRGESAAQATLIKAGQSGEEVVTSVVCVAEVLAGMRRGEELQTYTLLNQMRWLPLDSQAGQLAGELKVQWSRRGITLQLSDCLIAATVLVDSCSLSTANRKDFPMPRSVSTRLRDVCAARDLCLGVLGL